MKDPNHDKYGPAAYERRRRNDLRRLLDSGEVAFTEDYVYRPGEMLVGVSDNERVSDRLRRWGCRPDEETNSELSRRGLGVRRWRLADGESVPEVVSRLREAERGAPLIAGPNHIFGTEPRWAWGGGGAPSAAGPFDVEKAPSSSDEVRIGVLDTGVATDTEHLHPALFAQISDVTGDLDGLDDDADGLLDSGAGHGTFVLGVLHRLVPGLQYDIEPVLGAHGLGDDLSIAMGASQITGGVVNLSFGGYTHDNMEPPALRAVLDRLGRRAVIVAAAGNHRLTDPFWPAAFKDVVAVAAVDTRDPANVVPADFTNRGRWVDVCAPGVDIHSSYVRGTWPDEVGEFDGHAVWSGTSFAAPQVAAAIAELAVEQGIPPRAALAQLLANLSPLPGHPDMGQLYLPKKDLVYRP